MGGIFRASFLMIFVAVATVLTGMGAAQANPKYAAFVMHADTGDVLFDRYSNERRYPASLTKMMTLYLLFEAIEAGELSLTDDLPVSKRASLQPASRLGLSRGSTIKVETAIEALVIRSANDVATVVAEKIGGSEVQFARLMTAKAQDLGMRRTTFRNASGLPDRNQVTTARDMAILSQRLVQDFPDYFHYFDQDRFQWNGNTYRSHNRVAMNYSGADGLKTGYTRASGYNLATTAARGEHRLIGVVLGGRRTASRDAHMIKILDKAFLDIKRRPGLVKAIHYATPTPSLRPDRIKGLNEGMVLVDAGPDMPVPSVKAMLAAATPADMPTATGPGALDFAALEGAIAEIGPYETMAEDFPVGEGDADPAGLRNWIIQVGAYREQPQAINRIRETQELVRSVAAEAGREVNIAERGAKAVYRARFTGLTETEASNGCAAVREAGSECIALHVE